VTDEQLLLHDAPAEAPEPTRHAPSTTGHDWHWRMDPQPGKRWRYAPTYDGLRLFADDIRRVLHDDDDMVLLFTGEPGRGKSTFGTQLLRMVDPTFGVDRIHFTIQDFMHAAPRTPKHAGILADEFLASRRKAMRGEMIDLNDFFQVCRQFNLCIGLCFPSEHRMDLPILEDRVKFKIECPRRGLAILKQRIVRDVLYRGRARRIVTWERRGKWTFGPNRGGFDTAYRAKKDRHFTNRGIAMDAQPDEIAAAKTTLTPDDLGFDPTALEGAFRDLAARIAQREAADRPHPKGSVKV
jgi:hypothetical protein